MFDDTTDLGLKLKLDSGPWIPGSIYLPRNPCPTFYQPHQDTKIDKTRVRLFRARGNRQVDLVLRPEGDILFANCEFVPRHLHHHKLHMA